MTKLAEWAAAVRARDGKCRDCGSTEDLHAHHVKPKSTHPELTLDLDNGVTLCYRCHKAEHERNRPHRIRGDRRPQRKTLERRMTALEAEIRALKEQNRRLGQLVNECKRGACRTALTPTNANT